MASCFYTLTWKNELRIAMRAATDAVTLVNMAHHSYWNLGGHDAGLITDHELTLFADAYTPGDPLVPTGEVAAVAGTPFDFTAPKPIGRDLRAAGGDPIGYDHNFVVDGDPHALRPVARLVDPKTGRVLTVESDQPGVQFYSGNYLDGSVRGKGGKLYAQRSGLCLETQAFPNAINVPAWRDQVIVRPGKPYHQLMVHRFTTESRGPPFAALKGALHGIPRFQDEFRAAGGRDGLRPHRRHRRLQEEGARGRGGRGAGRQLSLRLRDEQLVRLLEHRRKGAAQGGEGPGGEGRDVPPAQG